jgi:hypothetical protein
MIAIALKNGILVILLILTVHFLLKRYLLENRTVSYRELEPVASVPPVPVPALPPPVAPLSCPNIIKEKFEEDEVYSHLFSSSAPVKNEPAPVAPPIDKPTSKYGTNKYTIVGDAEQKIDGFADLDPFDSFSGNYEEIK